MLIIQLFWFKELKQLGTNNLEISNLILNEYFVQLKKKILITLELLVDY